MIALHSKETRLPPLILASQSPRRVELLRQVVSEFQVTPSYTTELEDASMGPRRLCEVNAQRKAFSVAERFPDHMILGADTLVFLDGEALGKPADLTQARFMLGRLSGRVHEVITGVCLVQQSLAKSIVFSEVTRVRFRALSPESIADYVSQVDTLDKAGAYAIQDQGERLVESVEGSFSNVVGLPVDAVKNALARW